MAQMTELEAQTILAELRDLRELAERVLIKLTDRVEVLEAAQR